MTRSRAPHRPASEWQSIIAEFNAGADSEREFCAKRDIKLVTLRKWRYHFKVDLKRTADKKHSGSGFAKVQVRPRTDESPVHTGVTLRLGSDIRLECPSSFDASALARLALELHRGC